MADFEYTKVDPKRLKAVADNIDGGVAALDKAFADVSDALLGKLKSTWEGASGTAFFNQYKADSESFKSHIMALREVNIQLKEAAGIYDNADDKVGDLVSSLSV